MATITQTDLIDSIADSLQFMSYFHPLDFITAVNEAYEREESQAAKAAMAQILINSRMCAQGRRPICQDTGIVTVFVNVGMDVSWDAELSLSYFNNAAATQIGPEFCAVPKAASASTARSTARS